MLSFARLLVLTNANDPNRQFSLKEKAKDVFDKSGFSTKASLNQNLKVAQQLQESVVKGTKNLVDREIENRKARHRADQAGLQLPSTETFETRKCLTDLLDPSARNTSAMSLNHLTVKTRDNRHRDFILDKIFGKFHITSAATERDMGTAEKVCVDGASYLSHAHYRRGCCCSSSYCAKGMNASQKI